MLLSHTDAKRVCDDELGLTKNESLFERCVAWHETGYSGGWGPPKAPDGGEGSWNMGAVTTPHPDALSFCHKDSRFDPRFGKVVVYTTWFAGYESAAKGFEGLRDVLMRPNVKAALATGDFLGAVSAMYDNGYFLGLHTHASVEGDRDNIEDYYKGVVGALAVIAKETGEVQPEVAA